MNNQLREAFDKGYLRGVAEAEEKHLGRRVPDNVLNGSQYLEQMAKTKKSNKARLTIEKPDKRKVKIEKELNKVRPRGSKQ